MRDGKGQPASDLREQDFEVYEDGVLQSVRLFRHEDIPVTVGLVVDHSGERAAEASGCDHCGVPGRSSSSAARMDQMFVVNFQREKVAMGPSRRNSPSLNPIR